MTSTNNESACCVTFLSITRLLKYNLSNCKLLGPGLVISAVNFTLHNDTVDWPTAKSRCEALGQRLAVLDTEQKQTELQEQV